MQRLLCSRPVVFALASTSFACLLGQFYNLWSMRAFACWILLPATALLAYAACSACSACSARGEAAQIWIVQGALGGLVAACAYDLYRLPFVLQGAPLFVAFPRFGQMLLETSQPAWLVQLAGWTYHFSNGAALGIMFLTLAPRAPFWGAVLWALFVEAMLLLTPYTAFFGLKQDARFLFLTASAHLIFGVTLGLWCRWRTSGTGLRRMETRA